MQLAIIGASFTAIVGVFFAMQNNAPVTVDFLLWRFDTTLAMALLLALALGTIIIALLTTPATLRSQWRLSRQKRRIEALEKTCDNQRQRIVELESHIPAEPPTAASPPYLGLKQLISGPGADSPGEPGSSPN